MAVSIIEETFNVVKKISFEWTSDSSGDASGTTTNVYTGVIERLVTVPGTGGDQPTNEYDIEITDEDGVDVLVGAGADLSDTDTEQRALATTVGAMANDKLQLTVENAGDTKKGVVHLYIR
jgi:hypothetical protein